MSEQLKTAAEVAAARPVNTFENVKTGETTREVAGKAHEPPSIMDLLGPTYDLASRLKIKMEGVEKLVKSVELILGSIGFYTPLSIDNALVIAFRPASAQAGGRYAGRIVVQLRSISQEWIPWVDVGLTVQIATLPAIVRLVHSALSQSLQSFSDVSVFDRADLAIAALKMIVDVPSAK